MTEVYTIQKGDTLTKIAQRKYGLNGAEAYQKALEIAKENNIKNPNLIYTGHTLNLFGLGEEEAPQGDTFVQQTAPETAPEEPAPAPETKPEEKSLYQKIKENTIKYGLHINTTLRNELSELEDGFKIEDTSGYDANVHGNVRFAQLPETDDPNAKLEAYTAAVIELARQDIEANNKTDEEGEQDDVTDYEEFEKAQLDAYRASHKSIDLAAIRQTFIQEFTKQNGRAPEENEIIEGTKENIEAIENIYNDDAALSASMGLKESFDLYDRDANGTLDATEIAMTYIAADLQFGDDFKQSTLKMNMENEDGKETWSFDGNINFTDYSISTEFFQNNPQEYAGLYNIFSQYLNAAV